MRINHLVYRTCAAVLLLYACGLFYTAGAQTPADSSAGAQQTKATVVLPDQQGPQPVTGKANLYCGGFIQYAPSPNYLQIVGGEEEQEQRTYAPGDYVYINAGSQQGMRLGNEYTAARPRGQFRSKLSKKKGWLGVYTQEVGFLRVIEVKDNVSIAIVTSACDNLLLGDLLRATYTRVAPVSRTEAKLDRFANPTGKQKGRIVLARDTRELITVDQVVFIDLGTEDSVKEGDYLTISRPAGRGNITRFRDDEVALSATGGFESDIFKGGKFSNQSQRVEDANSTGVYGPTTSTPEVKAKRPKMPRKVVGEMVIIGVQKRTATAVITRIVQEVHTGDDVELQ